MGIDRPDEDDAPTAGRDSPAADRETHAVGNDASPDSEAARAAYNIEFRAIVEARYQAAAWAEAVPALETARAEHEERYPHPERSQPTLDRDGSWRAEGGLELSPAQNAEATREWAQVRERAHDDILPAMRRVEAEGAEGHLAGLEHWLKGEDRLKEKIAANLRAPDLTVTQALAMVPDAVRFTFIYNQERYAGGVLDDIQRLKAEGFEPIKLKKSWTDDQYKGINSQWRSPGSGLRFEVQFHTPESYEAKQLTHWAYERLRGSQATLAERQELEAYQRRVNTLIAAPPGIAGIDEIREKDR